MDKICQLKLYLPFRLSDRVDGEGKDMLDYLQLSFC